MPIPITCRGCHKQFTVTDRSAGKRGRCPQCSARFTTPACVAVPLEAPSRPACRPAVLPEPEEPVGRRRKLAGPAAWQIIAILAGAFAATVLVGLVVAAFSVPPAAAPPAADSRPPPSTPAAPVGILLRYRIQSHQVRPEQWTVEAVSFRNASSTPCTGVRVRLDIRLVGGNVLVRHYNVGELPPDQQWRQQFTPGIADVADVRFHVTADQGESAMTMEPFSP